MDVDVMLPQAMEEAAGPLTRRRAANAARSVMSRRDCTSVYRSPFTVVLAAPGVILAHGAADFHTPLNPPLLVLCNDGAAVNATFVPGKTALAPKMTESPQAT